MEEGEEVGGSRAEGSSAIGDGGQAAISFTPDVVGYANTYTHLHLWKLATWRFVCRGLTIVRYLGMGRERRTIIIKNKWYDDTQKKTNKRSEITDHSDSIQNTDGKKNFGQEM